MAEQPDSETTKKPKDAKSVTATPVLYDREGQLIFEGDEMLVDIPYIDPESGPDISTRRLFLLKKHGCWMASDGSYFNIPIRDLFAEAASLLGCCTFYGYAPAHQCGKKLHERHDEGCIYFGKKFRHKTLLQMSKTLGEEGFIEATTTVSDLVLYDSKLTPAPTNPPKTRPPL